jgi:hypothetical protein
LMDRRRRDRTLDHTSLYLVTSESFSLWAFFKASWM